MALACSGVLHAVLAIAATAWLALSPPIAPAPSTDRHALVAVLQDARPRPQVEEVTPVATPEPEPTPLVREAPKAMAIPTPAAVAPAPVAPPVARALPAPVRGPVTSSDPNGSVTMGLLDNPAILGQGIAARLAERYPGRIDKLPRLTGSMIVAYPPLARQARASARISAIVDVDERGRITHVALVPEHAWFGPVVMEALKDARFTPAELATNPVPYWAIVEFVFGIAPASVAAAEATGTEAAARATAGVSSATSQN